MNFTDEQLLIVAHATHEANRTYCLALGDTSQPTWDDAPDWQRQSALKGVRVVQDLLNQHAEGGPRAAPSIAGAILHQSWMDEKAATGWVYGPEKNPDTKTHPCMVPYAELPRAQRMKDKVFFTTARSMLRGLRAADRHLTPAIRYGRRCTQEAS